MTEAFASAVTVTVPILALAAGAEARSVRDRLRRPDADWEKEFGAHQAAHEFDPAKPPTEVLEYFKGVPGISKAYLVQRLLAVGSAIVWLVVFVLLLLPLDLVPDGLKKAVVPKLVTAQGRGFVKVLLSELEGAVDRAADKVERATTETAGATETPAAPGDGEPQETA